MKGKAEKEEKKHHHAQHEHNAGEGQAVKIEDAVHPQQELKEPAAPSHTQELEQQLLYLRADFENYRRNINKERLEMEDKGRDDILKRLFAIIEHMERALENGKKHQIDPSFIEGLELVNKEIYRVLESYGVERIKSLGEKFDPKIHEAVSIAPAPGEEPGTIIFEQQPGFIRNGRLLQPARVVVASEESGEGKGIQ
jgi:molecular chaperone GrpE